VLGPRRTCGPGPRAPPGSRPPKPASDVDRIDRAALRARDRRGRSLRNRRRLIVGMCRVADVAFDVPLDHAFSYRVPAGWTVIAGQRVAGPLRRAERIGVVVALRESDGAGLKPLTRVVDEAPALDGDSLELARWITEQSLSSLGSTLSALMPPVVSPVMNSGGPEVDGPRLRLVSERESA